mmetsp:Transcript_37355/g.89850  ORF Transcript_37355/g.89850 Transcript_37355/m.89850 type:complete len:250 (-) Transcript_37355:274-1023(-)
MRGPTSPAACPGFRVPASFTTASTRGWKVVPSGSTTSNTLAAMHRCPQHPANDATTSVAVWFTSASGRATRWFLAPPRETTRLCSLWHREATSSATLEDPTKVTARTRGESISAFTTGAVPFTVLNTPSGNPASCMSSQTRRMVRGTFSLGFRTTQFPITRAMGVVHMGTIRGKLKGTIQATTPRGTRSSRQWMPPETSRIFPCATCGNEQAYSTVSFPLATSARASALFFPFSNTMRSASSSACSRIR